MGGASLTPAYFTRPPARLPARRLRLQALAEELLRRDGRFELAVPPRFGLLCFRLAGASDAQNEELLSRLNATGGLASSRASKPATCALHGWGLGCGMRHGVRVPCMLMAGGRVCARHGAWSCRHCPTLHITTPITYHRHLTTHMVPC